MERLKFEEIRIAQTQIFNNVSKVVGGFLSLPQREARACFFKCKCNRSNRCAIVLLICYYRKSPHDTFIITLSTKCCCQSKVSLILIVIE
jgi:hypothetical protein